MLEPAETLMPSTIERQIERPIQRPRQIPSLDGLRALSIVLVVAVHTLQHRSLTHKVPAIFFVLGNGALGVEIFFVLSGYLITLLLLREREQRGSVSLRSFYVRRGFRILPPLYLYIACMGVLGAWRRLPGMDWQELTTALTFTRNYVPGMGLWVFEHLWSLCIEEQFYLLWPTLLVWMLLRRSDATGRARAAKVALAVIVAEPLVRVLCFRFLPGLHSPGMIHMRADGLMFGALGALLQGTARFERWYRAATRWPATEWLMPALLFFVSGALGLRFGNYWTMPAGLTLDGLLILLWMLWLVRNPRSWTGRAMNQPAVMWLGRLSYSLYIWQTFFLHHDNVAVFERECWFNAAPGAWVCLLAVAALSYYAVEQPALRLRDRVLLRMHWHEL
jgi:peptidoglycan/LPS O-acetylase OafA/YrhL